MVVASEENNSNFTKQHSIKVSEYLGTTSTREISLLLFQFLYFYEHMQKKKKKEVHTSTIHAILCRPFILPVAATLVNFIHPCLTYYYPLKVL